MTRTYLMTFKISTMDDGSFDSLNYFSGNTTTRDVGQINVLIVKMTLKESGDGGEERIRRFG